MELTYRSAININLEKEKVSKGATQFSYFQVLRVLEKDYNLPDPNLPAATEQTHPKSPEQPLISEGVGPLKKV